MKDLDRQIATAVITTLNEQAGLTGNMALDVEEFIEFVEISEEMNKGNK